MIPVRDIFILHKIYILLNFTFILLQRGLQRGLKNQDHQSLVVQNTGIKCVPYIAKNKKILKYLTRFFIIFSAAMTDFIKSAFIIWTRITRIKTIIIRPLCHFTI